jgi:copper chaperone CopZ
MNGVIKAEASFITGLVKIRFDDTKTSVEQIVTNFKTKGFTVLGTPKMLQ